MLKSNYSNINEIHALNTWNSERVHIESHTLPIIGITLGLLTILMGQFSQLFSNIDKQNIMFIELAVCVAILITALVVDYRLTISRITKRHMVISLTQKKLMQIIWAVIGISVILVIHSLTNLNSSKLALWFLIFIFAKCLFVFGLFSTRWYLISSFILFALSIATLILINSIFSLKYFAASVFIWGGILISLFSPYTTNIKREIILSFTWVSAVLVSTWLIQSIYEEFNVPENHTNTIALSDYSNTENANHLIVHIPKTSKIHINTHLDIDIFSDAYERRHNASVKNAIDIVMEKGKPTGVFRINQGQWYKFNKTKRQIKYDRINTLTPDEGPLIERHHTLKVFLN